MSEAGSHERSHALLGGSTAHRWVPCPGSVFYIKDMPPEISGEHALLGTKAHECAEMCIEDFLKHKEDGSDPDIRTHLWAKDLEMEEHILNYRDHVWKEVLHESITGKFYELEVQVVLDRHLDMSGYIDFCCVHVDDRAKRCGIVGDFKYGHHPVTAVGNSQLAFYAVALQETFKLGGKPLDYIRAFIFQPRARGKDSYEETKFTAAQLESWRAKFFKAAELIFVKKTPRFKVGDHCRFCRAQPFCSTYQKHITSETSLKLVEIETEVLPEPKSLPEETLIKIVLHEEKLLSFVKACKKYAFEKLSEGKTLKGLKLVEGNSRRGWKKDSVEEVGQRLMQLGMEEPYDLELKTIGEVEKILFKIHGKDETKKLLLDLCPKGPPPVVLAPESDSRNPVKKAVEFLDVELEE